MKTASTEKILSIVTFNTFGRPFLAPDITMRYIKAAQLLNTGNYDIICLQEIFTYYHLFLFQKHLNNFPHIAYKKNPFGPKGGLVIFSKHPVEEKKYSTYRLPKKTTIPWYVYLAQPGILSIKIHTKKIIIATTHLSSDIVSDLTPKNKLYKLIRSQLFEAAKEVYECTKKDDFFIFTGDFNIAKNSKLYKEFLQKSTLKDSFEEEETPTYSPIRIKSFDSAPPGRIDYIFLQSKIISLQNNHIFVNKEKLKSGRKSYLSDHIGLHCTLEVNE